MMSTPGGTEYENRQRRDRSRRVILLIVGVVLLSLGDLLITITYLQSTGMLEANPIAGYIIRVTGSVSILTAYKALTVGICVGLLYRLRRLVEGEVAAWCAVSILAFMSFQWFHYARQFDTTDLELARSIGFGEEWLMLD
ncbi:MAG: DUF5658 family protein [Planctomycetota bacterium]|jgi:hypothetical protein